LKNNPGDNPADNQGVRCLIDDVQARKMWEDCREERSSHGQEDEEAESEDAGVDRGAKAPPFVSRPGPHGPRAGMNPAKLGKIDNHE
jgi:hypothetical protein